MKAYPQLRRPTGIDTIPADARIITPGGRSIPAHCSILASASPVLESLLYRPTRRRWNPHDHKTIFIPGVSCVVIETFLSLIYSQRCLKKETEKEAMRMYGMHLLVLSHAYSIGWLKRAAEMALAEQLTTEVVVDVLHLARQCDASQLYIQCMKWIAKNFATVEMTEGWRFVRAHDPWLELNVLQFLQDTDLRLNRRRKKMWEQGLYLQLSEAMECLAHICTEGCIGVGPYDKEPRKGPCASFKTCQSLQLLIRHFAICGRKQGCTRCKWMWQLLRLHSSICVQFDNCKVPLCRQFRISSQQMDGRGQDMRWIILAKKVASIKVMSELIKNKSQEPLSNRAQKCSLLYRLKLKTLKHNEIKGRVGFRNDYLKY